MNGNAESKSERALPEREARVKHFLESVPGSVYQIEISPEGKIAFPYVSRRLREMTGLDPQGFQEASRMRELISPEDRERIVTAIQKGAASLAPFELEFKVLTPAGPRHIHNRYSVSRRTDGSTIITGISTDITDRKMAVAACVTPKKNIAS